MYVACNVLSTIFSDSESDDNQSDPDIKIVQEFVNLHKKRYLFRKTAVPKGGQLEYAFRFA